MHSESFISSDEPGFGGSRLPLLYNMVYCSRAAADVDAAAVDRIVASAHRNNPRLNITGMLVFGEGIFFQWLEGPRASITGLMEQLRRDVRHSDLIVISEIEESRERLFPDWDMELVEAGHIREVLVDTLAVDHEPRNAAALRSLLAQLDARLSTSVPIPAIVISQSGAS